MLVARCQGNGSLCKAFEMFKKPKRECQIDQRSREMNQNCSNRLKPWKTRFAYEHCMFSRKYCFCARLRLKSKRFEFKRRWLAFKLKFDNYDVMMLYSGLKLCFYCTNSNVAKYLMWLTFMLSYIDSKQQGMWMLKTIEYYWTICKPRRENAGR